MKFVLFVKNFKNKQYRLLKSMASLKDYHRCEIFKKRKITFINDSKANY